MCRACAQHMRKNQYEEALFRCEDDRFELDMVIESNASAVRAITPLVQQLSEMTPDEKANWRLPPNTLTPIHYRAIQKIYGACPFCTASLPLWSLMSEAGECVRQEGG